MSEEAAAVRHDQDDRVERPPPSPLADAQQTPVPPANAEVRAGSGNVRLSLALANETCGGDARDAVSSFLAALGRAVDDGVVSSVDVQVELVVAQCEAERLARAAIGAGSADPTWTSVM